MERLPTLVVSPYLLLFAVRGQEVPITDAAGLPGAFGSAPISMASETDIVARPCSAASCWRNLMLGCTCGRSIPTRLWTPSLGATPRS